MTVAGYETEILKAFVLEHGITRDDGELASLNEVACSYSTRKKLVGWWERPLIPMDRVDRFLMEHDLMLFELEYWAQDHYGRDGYLDPNAEPAQLAM